jgi:Tfp pilus assembly protein PilO
MEEALKAILWRLHRWVEGVGLGGWVGAILLMLCVVGWVGWYLPAERESVRLREDNATLTSQIHKLGDLRSQVAESPTQVVDRFYRLLPSANRVSNSIGTIEAAAASNGITLEQGEFKLIPDADGRLTQYQIVFPFKADYRKTRSFVRTVLRELQTIALDEISFRREDSKAAQLETRLRFVLYLSTSS